MARLVPAGADQGELVDGGQVAERAADRVVGHLHRGRAAPVLARVDLERGEPVRVLLVPERRPRRVLAYVDRGTFAVRADRTDRGDDPALRRLEEQRVGRGG